MECGGSEGAEFSQRALPISWPGSIAQHRVKYAKAEASFLTTIKAKLCQDPVMNSAAKLRFLLHAGKAWMQSLDANQRNARPPTQMADVGAWQLPT